MARIHFVVPEADKVRYVSQAGRERKSLGEWMREAAAAKLRASRRQGRFRSAAEMGEFLKECHERAGPGREPDWEETKRLILDSKIEGLATE